MSPSVVQLIVGTCFVLQTKEKEEVKRGYGLANTVMLRMGGMYGRDAFSAGILIFNSTLAAFCLSGPLTVKDGLHGVEALHHGVLILALVIVGLVTQRKKKTLDRLLWWVGTGFYRYSGEPEPSPGRKADSLAELGRTSRLFSTLLFGCGVTLSLVTPFSRILNSSPVPPGVSPFLPLAIVFPFSVETWPGFLAAYWYEAIGVVVTLLMLRGVDMTFVSLTVHLKCQFQILNDSIADIENRAVKRMAAERNVDRDTTDVDRLYQECMYQCLRQNVRHYQALLRFYKQTRIFWGKILFILLINASFLIGIAIYLTLETTGSAEDFIKYLLILMSEMCHIFLYCIYGEMVFRESERTLERLFHVPWFKCNKKFKRMLNIFQTAALYPIRIQSGVIKQTASLEAYYLMMGTAYSYFNIAREIKQEFKT